MIKNENLIRKLIHVGIGLTIFLLTFPLSKSEMLWLLAGGSLFSFISYPFKAFRFLHKTTSNSLGTLFYPAGLLAAFLLLYNSPMELFRTALLLLTIADTAANLTGNIKWKNSYFRILSEKKSLFGTLAFVCSSWIIFLLLLPDQMIQNTSFLIFLALLSANLEVISFKGSDNFTIPAGTALVFTLTELYPQESFTSLILLIMFFATGGYLLYRLNILTRAGSLFAYLLGVYLAGIAGFSWTLPVVYFFLSSVALTQMNTFLNGKAKTANRRNAWQVLANILPAVISSALFLITKNEIYIFLFIALIAAVTADTWASEIGPVFNKRCFSLADFQMKRAGISGGISLAGSLAALVASFTTAWLSVYLFFNQFDLRSILVITFSGFMASLVDSLLGAFIEPGLLKKKFFNHETEMASHTERITPNDLVNIAGSLSATLFLLALAG